MSAQAIILESTPDPRVLHRQFCAAMAGEGDVRVDAGAVQRFPASCIQLFAAVDAELKPAGRRLVVQNPSFPFGLAFEALGFEGDRELFSVEYL